MIITEDSNPLPPTEKRRSLILGLSFEQAVTLIVVWTLPELIYTAMMISNPSDASLLLSHHIGQRMTMFALASTVVGATTHLMTYRKMNRQIANGIKHPRFSSYLVDTVVIAFALLPPLLTVLIGPASIRFFETLEKFGK